MLFVFADGIAQIKPKIIFHAITRDQIIKKEKKHWNKNVTVEFNPTAYNNEDLFLKFINEKLVPALNPNFIQSDYLTNLSSLKDSFFSYGHSCFSYY